MTRPEYMRAYYLANREKWCEFGKRSRERRKTDPVRMAKNRATNQRSREKHADQRRKDCQEWRRANAARVSEYNKQWHKANSEKALALNRNWRTENRDKRNSQLRERYYSDILYRVEITLRNRLKSAIKRRLHRPHDCPETETLIGCTLDQFSVWIEQHFVAGMTWENYGKWHIDHTRPCCSFDLTDPAQQLECFHYTNLKPLWAIDNCQKSSFWGGFRHHRSHRDAYRRRALAETPSAPVEPNPKGGNQ